MSLISSASEHQDDAETRDVSSADLDTDQLLDRVLRFERLTALFQPLFNLENGTLLGYEGLIRGPTSTPLHTAGELFANAERLRRRTELEFAAARTVIRAFAAERLDGYLLLNMSCTALIAASDRPARALEFIAAAGLSPSAVMIELTEQEHIRDVPALAQALRPLAAGGISLVLDDFGDGHSNLRLWMELHPRMVKIDRFFVKGLGSNGDKFEIVRLLKRFADSFGTQLVAEGIEDVADLMAARDLGIPFGQGFLLGRPERKPSSEMPAELQSTIRSLKLTVAPQRENVPARSATVGDLSLPIPPIDTHSKNDDLAALFAKHPDYNAIAIIDADRPVGLINRHRFVDRYAQPFQREIHGRKSCSVFSEKDPATADRRTPLEALRGLLAGDDQRYLRDGLIITDNGRYFGLATGESIVRAVMELRIEAARYANPLTFLPGNIPISQHLDRLIGARVPFSACYADLNHFKPFNDQYGYWRGDEVIRLAASVLQDQTDPLVDFIGHVGGDDFFLVFQSEDWADRCEVAIERFNTGVRAYFAPDEISASGFWGEDRKGCPCFFPLTTISIGAVVVSPDTFDGHEEIASAAAAAKRIAKATGIGLHRLDTRAGA
jgi:EAL domain-containing protein (putative c-di-GMP-specific phosphodiesterase class I)/GGDEF domain-containing protein